ncbi:MAG: DUF2510 domain-containing protein [Actinomycetaceae bacterium]|nr:DUF2510 domain-containing protein [Actinomycetaceae bacterium]
MSQAPGWYPDQFDPRYERYWDGGAWGQARPRAVSPGGPAQVPAVGGPHEGHDGPLAPSGQTAPGSGLAQATPGSGPAYGAAGAGPAPVAGASDAYGTPTPVRDVWHWGDVVLLGFGIALMVFPALFAYVLTEFFDNFEDDDGVSRLVLNFFLIIPALFFLVGFLMTVAWVIRRLTRRRKVRRLSRLAGR